MTFREFSKKKFKQSRNFVTSTESESDLIDESFACCSGRRVMEVKILSNTFVRLDDLSEVSPVKLPLRPGKQLPEIPQVNQEIAPQLI